LPELLAVRVRDALAAASARLADAGCDTPRLDAELLLGEVLGVGRERLVLDARSLLDPAAMERFQALVGRRVAREPVAYILGRKEFRRITLTVDHRVLIPRPETELLVEVGLSFPAGASVVDVGTGSGAVALALKHERPDLRVWGTDSSAAAITAARDNAPHLGLEVHFTHTDLLPRDRERFYAILTNLPYVPDGTVLPPEIARYEPAGALFGGADGLDVIRRLLGMVAWAGPVAGPRSVANSDDARPVARAGGPTVVALEVGAGQAEAVAGLVRDAGFPSVERLRDLAGHERVVVGRR
jgi:release factor glutamine methyltransferase